MTCRLRWYGKMETRCRIPIWRTFGRMLWHVILELPATLQGAATWRILCHDPRTVSHYRVLPPGEFNGMSSQRHVSHCRVLPLGEFTVIIPKPHATLQGVIIPSAILDIVFRRILFIVVFFLNAVGLWRAAAFVSSPIHLFCIEKLFKTVFCICVWHTFITRNSE